MNDDITDYYSNTTETIIAKCNGLLMSRLNDTVGELTFKFDVDGIALKNSALTACAMIYNLMPRYGNDIKLCGNIVAKGIWAVENAHWVKNNEENILNDPTNYFMFKLKSVSSKIKKSYLNNAVQMTKIPNDGEREFISLTDYVMEKCLNLYGAYVEYAQTNHNKKQYIDDNEKLIRDSAEEVNKMYLNSIGFTATVNAKTNKPELFLWLSYYIDELLSN